MKSLSQQQTNSVISLLQQGHSSRNVASITGFHHSTVSKICIKHCPDLPKPSGGHPPKLSSTASSVVSRTTLEMGFGQRTNSATQQQMSKKR